MTKASNIHFHPAFLTSVDESAPDPRPNLERPCAPIPASSEKVLEQRLGEELFAVQRWIENVVHNLGTDPVLHRRHANELAALRRVAETASDLASIIASADKGMAIGRARQPELKARLERKAIRPLFEAKH